MPIIRLNYLKTLNAFENQINVVKHKLTLIIKNKLHHSFYQDRYGQKSTECLQK